MRNRNVIEAEIYKLQAELADVNEYERARDSAIHILKNLGWTRKYGRWIKPEAKCGSVGMQTFDANKMTHIKAGDFCESNINGYIWYVHKVEGTDIWCSRVTRIDAMGVFSDMQQYKMNHKNLHVTDPRNFMGYRKSTS